MRYPAAEKLEIIQLVEHFRRLGDLLTFCRSAARPERDERSATGVSDFMAPSHENLYGQDN